MACELEPDPQRYQDVLRQAFAKHYAERSDVWTHDEAMAAFPQAVNTRLELSPTSRVLDLGCGAGRDVESFSRWGASVVGLDLYAHPTWPSLQSRLQRVSFVACDFLDFKHGESFNLIFDNGCFHHQHPQRYEPYLRNVCRHLAPGGHYVVSTFKNPAQQQRVDDNGRLHRYFSDDELHQELSAAGLSPGEEFAVLRVAHGDHYRVTFCTRTPAGQTG